MHVFKEEMKKEVEVEIYKEVDILKKGKWRKRKESEACDRERNEIKWFCNVGETYKTLY